MKRTALVLGVAAALALPATASAGNSLQVKPQVKMQVVAQVKPQVKAQVVAQIVTTQRLKTNRIALRRMSR